jgi:hypothetical protein
MNRKLKGNRSESVKLPRGSVLEQVLFESMRQEMEKNGYMKERGSEDRKYGDWDA